MLDHLFSAHVIPAPIHTLTDADLLEQLRSAARYSRAADAPVIDVMIDPIAVATVVAHLVDGPFATDDELEAAVWDRAGDRESPDRFNWNQP